MPDPKLQRRNIPSLKLPELNTLNQSSPAPNTLDLKPPPRGLLPPSHLASLIVRLHQQPTPLFLATTPTLSTLVPTLITAPRHPKLLNPPTTPTTAPTPILQHSLVQLAPVTNVNPSLRHTLAPTAPHPVNNIARLARPLHLLQPHHLLTSSPRPTATFKAPSPIRATFPV